MDKNLCMSQKYCSFLYIFFPSNHLSLKHDFFCEFYVKYFFQIYKKEQKSLKKWIQDIFGDQTQNIPIIYPIFDNDIISCKYILKTDIFRDIYLQRYISDPSLTSPRVCFQQLPFFQSNLTRSNFRVGSTLFVTRTCDDW